MILWRGLGVETLVEVSGGASVNYIVAVGFSRLLRS